MAEKKTDRRTLKTRKAVFCGLAELLAEKELRNITVQEMSDHVDIHRVTFYKHFMDIYDVCEQPENAIIGNWVLIDFAQPEAFIADMLPGLDKSTQGYLTSLLEQ